jgi:signal recognition particle subunit SRP54
MDELRAMKDELHPQNTLLVIDAMIGQGAVDVAQEFNERIGLDGVIITKIDGDARGGAALSVKEVVGKSILFAGTGEKLDEFEVFHPDRMASRILGMGDLMTLIEKAETTYDAQQKERAEEILREGTFTLDDFLGQLQQVKKMGPLQQVMGMLPGLPKELKGVDVDDRELVRIEAIIQSMTMEERRRPELINGSRRNRIAKGSGTNTNDVNNLLKQFKQMQQMMKQMGVMGKMAQRANKKNKKKGKGGGGPKPRVPAGLPPNFDLSKLGGDLGGVDLSKLGFDPRQR